MQSSGDSCSPVNSAGSPEFICSGVDYELYVQMMAGVDPYAPGYTPAAPADSPIPTVPSFQFGSCPVIDEIQAQYGFYPIEVLEGSDPLEFIVRYPYPWDPSPRGFWDEWSMVIVESRFLDHLTWFEGEWHLVWGTFTGPVYREL